MSIFSKLSALLICLLFAICGGNVAMLQAQSWDWAATGGGLSTEEIFGMSHDPFGNTIIVGTFRGEVSFGSEILPYNGNFGTEIFVVKYDPSGQVVWARKIDGEDHDYISGVDTDQAGNVYLTGTFKDDLQFGVASLRANRSLNRDGFIAKYDVNGNFQWVRQLKSRHYDSRIRVADIATDAQGNNIIVGDFRYYIDLHDGNHIRAHQDDHGIFAIKYDAQGAIVWFRVHYSSGSSQVSQIVLNKNGEYFLSAKRKNNQDDFMGIVEKYNPFGTRVWSKEIRRNGAWYSFMPQIATDQYSGKLWVAGPAQDNLIIDTENLGYVESGAWGRPSFLALFSASGTLEWTRVDDRFGPYDQFYTLLVDEAGMIYGGGNFVDSLRLPNQTVVAQHLGREAFVMGMNPEGGPLWIHAVPGPYNDVVSELLLDQGGNLIVGGTFTSQIFFDNQSVYAGGSDVFVGKLVGIPPYTSTALSDRLAKTISLKAYPNPCVDRIYVQFPANSFTHGQLSIFSMQGQEVLRHSLRIRELQEGGARLQLPLLPEGLYQVFVSGEQGSLGRMMIQISN